MSRGNFASNWPWKISQDPMLQSSATNGPAGVADDATRTFVSEEIFRREISQERKRCERSRNRFLLMLVHAGGLLQGEQGGAILSAITNSLFTSIRDTDLRGWYEKDATVGVICTEIGLGSMPSIISALRSRVSSALRKILNPDLFNALQISFHVFPDDLALENGGSPADSTLYPDLKPHDNAIRASQAIKRAMDMIGSLFAIVLLAPLFIVIAVAIKLTSKGPILFRQTRVGQYGVRFTFLKFRSMCFQSDAKVHRDYVRRLISASRDPQRQDDLAGTYKMTDDPRITPFGRFLRKSSLDELPQFFNVLKGEMSLVGPRPPIPYEVEAYDIWHSRRFLEVKPGITGLWQVEGRSRTRFDEMVRMDLRYVRTWSLWLDIKILLRTPWAVLRGNGAY